ncbi:hypothetical protein NDU88_004149 [Pleurodeles waltl]|uniref:Uncharacterized protein n=1 Tax=Pleurodeles waltl TaxID=8319 RepID=A0AAV7RIA8_PLEWA|nr:hypothetical protein NDU88_004149 [Pleurodeles waltl]
MPAWLSAPDGVLAQEQERARGEAALGLEKASWKEKEVQCMCHKEHQEHPFTHPSQTPLEAAPSSLLQPATYLRPACKL